MLERLLPKHVDNSFEGHQAALWILWLLVALMLIVSIRSIVSTESVAIGADGIPLDSFGPVGARTVLMLFALDSVGTLIVALVAVAVLVRYRAMVPFIYLLLIGGQIARRLIIQAHAVPRTEGSIGGWYVVFGIFALLGLGLTLSLISTGERRPVPSREF